MTLTLNCPRSSGVRRNFTTIGTVFQDKQTGTTFVIERVLDQSDDTVTIEARRQH